MVDEVSPPTQEEIDSNLFYVKKLLKELEKRVVGQRKLLNRLLIGLLSGGHLLIEGLPGLAKTLSVETLSEIINMDFKRIQFTPDLLPADLIGTMVYNPKTTEFEPRKGPIFSNIILADEINRAPAKVQSALLEAMQERQVTIGNNTFKLPEIFMALATQNPIEQEGTYPLPEAEMDRFLMKVVIDYPLKRDEKKLLDRISSEMLSPVEAASSRNIKVEKIIVPERIKKLRLLANRIYVDDRIKNYMLDIVFATRKPDEYNLEIGKYIRYGASPRGSLALFICAKINSFLEGRNFVVPEDIKKVVYDVLRHRIILSFEAEAENISQDEIIKHILSKVEVP